MIIRLAVLLYSTLLYSKALDSLGGCHLLVAGEDTEHQGYEGQQGHAEPEVGHVVLSLGLGQAVSQRRLQAHKQHTGGEGDTCSDIVENFGIIHLSYKERRREERVREKEREKCLTKIKQKISSLTADRNTPKINPLCGNSQKGATSASFYIKLLHQIIHCSVILC